MNSQLNILYLISSGIGYKAKYLGFYGFTYTLAV